MRPRPESPAGPFDRTLSVTAAWGLFESANLFVRRETFEAVGGFQSWLSPRRGIELGEDVWLGWRVRRSGAPTGFCADALAYHEVFPRSARAYVAERARLRFFPAMAARIPELREDFFWRRLFLNRRSALFDLAVAGTLAAAARRSPLPLLAAAPYAREAYRHARRAGTPGASLRWRRPTSPPMPSAPPLSWRAACAPAASSARTSRAGGSRRASRRASPRWPR